MSNRLTLQRELCFTEIIEGETDCLERQISELGLVDRLKALDVAVRSLEINAAGCFLVIDDQDVARLRIAARPFNFAVRLHEHCGAIVLRGDDKASLLAVLRNIISVFHHEHLAIVHVATTGTELTLLVDDEDIEGAMHLVEPFCRTLAHEFAA